MHSGTHAFRHACMHTHATAHRTSPCQRRPAGLHAHGRQHRRWLHTLGDGCIGGLTGQAHTRWRGGLDWRPHTHRPFIRVLAASAACVVGRAARLRLHEYTCMFGMLRKHGCAHCSEGAASFHPGLFAARLAALSCIGPNPCKDGPIPTNLGAPASSLPACPSIIPTMPCIEQLLSVT